MGVTTGLRKFEIQLDKPDLPSFAPGEIIAGRVIVDLTAPEITKGLKVKIRGKGKVKWRNESENGETSTDFKGVEDYVKMEIYVMGGVDGQDEEIAAGSHVFPFQFFLPLNIPSSFNTSNGSINYAIEAVIEKVNFSHETSKTFIVHTPYDLSQCRTPITAIDDEQYDSYCCFSCFNSKCVRVGIFMPTNGYAIGEAIKVMVNISNRATRVDVSKIELELQQKLTLHSQLPHVAKKSYEEIVESIEETGPFSKRNQVEASLIVPILPYSEMIYCRLIDVEYELRVSITANHVSPNFNCNCGTTKCYPIVIGTKPGVQPAQNPTAVSAPPGERSSESSGDQYNATHSLLRTGDSEDANSANGLLEKLPPSYDDAVGHIYANQ